MGLAAPWFLAGLAAIALPLYLHLLRRRRGTPLRFSSLMFFEPRTQSSVKQRRLEHLLLLALRISLLAAIALAFARPYIPGPPGSPAGGKLVILALDNSFSMRQGGRLDRARREASRVLSRLKPEDKVQVLAFASQAELMNEPEVDRAAVTAALEAIRAGDLRSSYGELVRALNAIAQSSQSNLEVHLFSDMQQTSMPAAFAELALPAGATLRLHPAAEETLPNWAVESVDAPPRVEPGRQTRVRAAVAGYGAPDRTLRVVLLLNGRRLASTEAQAPAGGRAAVEFTIPDVPYGQNRGEVRLENGDSFPEDDGFRFPLERSDPARVLFVHENRDSRSPAYFRAALEAAAPAVFAVETATPSEVAQRRPEDYSFTVLSNIGALPREFEDRLRRNVTSGGSLMIALGSASALRGSLPVVDGTIAESRYASRQAERFQAVDWSDAAHPSVRSAGRWEGVRFFQTFALRIGEARTVVRLGDQTPVLLEKDIGAGRVLLFASTLDGVANDFPLHAAFVPFVDETARYLAAMDAAAGVQTAGAYYELRRAGREGGVTEVLDPQGRRLLDLAQTLKAPGVRLLDEGFYQIRRAGGRQELVAVNADRRESDLTPVPSETLAMWQNTSGAGPSTPAGAGPVAPDAGRPLWRAVLAAAFLLALVEAVAAAGRLALKKEVV